MTKAFHIPPVISQSPFLSKNILTEWNFSMVSGARSGYRKWRDSREELLH